MTTGTCKHGKFDLMEGCEECVTERRAAGIIPQNDEMEEGLNAEGSTLVEEEPTLLEQVKIVAEARRIVQIAVGNKKLLVKEWEEKYSGFLADLQLNVEVVNDAEAKLRKLTIKAYNETGSKNPCPGVGIREVTKLEYDPKEAFKWALEHKIVLKLDTPAFEKMAKMASETRPSFVTISTEPQATIAQDLDTVLK